MDEREHKRINNDFSWVKKDRRILSLLLFGSSIKGKKHIKSDIDIAIVVPGVSNFYYDCKNIDKSSVDPSEILRKVFREVNTANKKYDVHIFEELPLHIKIDIINKHKIIYTSDKNGMFEYFYNYRKLWDDQKHRNTISKDLLLSFL